MKALTAAEMREVDRLTTERYGVSSLQLMENAGTRVANVVRESIAAAGGHPAKICVLCGKGNNGGDAFVAARHLQDPTAQIKLLLFGHADELRGDAATNCHRWMEMGGQIIPISDAASWDSIRAEMDSAQVIVDGIFGTGFHGSATGAVAKAIDDINRFSRNATGPKPPLILAVDTPSGLPSDGQPPQGPVLYAHKTVTFTAPKVGQLTSADSVAAGSLEVVNIGSPASLVGELGKGALRWSEPQEFARFPLVRTADSHKGLYGHLLVVAGSLGKTGAAIMSGYAGLCAGAGLVTVAAPDVVLPIIAAAHPEYMMEPLASTGEGTASAKNVSKRRFEQIQERKTVLAVGPGLGLYPETQDFIRAAVRQTELPVVLDADGLNAFAGHADELRERKTKFLAITPHPGEMASLLKASTKAVQQDRIRTAQDAAQRWNVHVVLKGFHTIIASPDGQLFINTSGNPGLAKGGSGDVLTGLLAALTAQFKTAEWTHVLALGVYLHGVAAEIAVHGTDPSGLLATDVARAIPSARLKLLQELQWRG